VKNDENIGNARTKEEKEGIKKGKLRNESLDVGG
jgi:hypothetical protein